MTGLSVRVLLLGGVALLSLQHGGCQRDLLVNPVCRQEELNGLLYEELRTVIASCSPREQVDLYLYSIWTTHPPSYEIADDVARANRNLAAPILDRLGEALEAHDDYSIRALLVLVAAAQDRGLHPDEARTLPAFESAISAMRDEDEQESAADWLRDIRHRAGLDP